MTPVRRCSERSHKRYQLSTMLQCTSAKLRYHLYAWHISCCALCRLALVETENILEFFCVFFPCFELSLCEIGWKDYTTPMHSSDWEFIQLQVSFEPKSCVLTVWICVCTGGPLNMYNPNSWLIEVPWKSYVDLSCVDLLVQFKVSLIWRIFTFFFFEFSGGVYVPVSENRCCGVYSGARVIQTG